MTEREAIEKKTPCLSAKEIQGVLSSVLPSFKWMAVQLVFTKSESRRPVPQSGAEAAVCSSVFSVHFLVDRLPAELHQLGIHGIAGAGCSVEDKAFTQGLGKTLFVVHHTGFNNPFLTLLSSFFSFCCMLSMIRSVDPSMDYGLP